MAHTESQYAELQEAFELLQDIVTDEPLRDALLGFPERWLNAQSVLDKERLGGMVAFEIIFAILTAGIGTAANAAAKSKHLIKANEALQQASKLLRRKRLNTQSRIDLKPDSKTPTPINLDTQVDTKKLELEDKPKVVPVRSMKQHTPPCFTPGDALKESFKGDTKALEKEFYKQLKAQEAGLNKMTVGRYLENRNILNALTEEHGHKKARAIITKGGVEQARARAKLEKTIKNSIFNSLIKKGENPVRAKQQAKKLAEEQLTELAALHEPDLIAGGDDTIRKLGNKNVNASLGSQWSKGQRVDGMDDAAKHAATKFGPETKMNIKLERCR